MGGVSAADTANAMKINMGTNNKLQVIAFDFDLITKTIDAGKDDQRPNRDIHTLQGEEKTSMILPDTDLVQGFANLLNVKLGGESQATKFSPPKKGDDLSRLTGEVKNKEAEKRKKNQMNSSLTDVRAKYAKKIRSKVDGSIVGIENMKSQRDEALQRGDAAGHLFARSIAASNKVESSGKKWIAKTGVGKLLDFLSSRSMKICLLPSPASLSKESRDLTKTSMEDLRKQLSNIEFHFFLEVKEQEDDTSSSVQANFLLENVSSNLGTKPISIIVVSNRDDFLRNARDRGMYTCRVRRKDQPRGNVTADYTVESMKDVEDIVNEVNGISFNSVFSTRQ